MPEGVEIFVGATQYGKTTLALEHAYRANDQAQPFLVLDCMPAKNFRPYPHAVDRVDVLRRLYGKPERNVIYTPKSEEDLSALFKHVHAAGVAGEPRTILWDECSFFMSPNYVPDLVSIALRGWAHSGNYFLLVTQRPADLNGVVFITSPKVYCFHLDRGADLERVEKEWQMVPDQVRALPVGKCLTFPRAAA